MIRRVEVSIDVERVADGLLYSPDSIRTQSHRIEAQSSPTNRVEL
jgi:hypothetical protein